MNRPNPFRSALLTVALGATFMSFGQSNLVDQRDQAEGWYLPVHGMVTADGQKAEGYSITVYRENKEVARIPANKKARFELQMDIDQMYTVRVTKPGYQEKLIHVDTSLPKDLVKYPAYECNMNLLPVNAKSIDPFYTDFPSAIVRYNAEMGGFYHSEHYLTHIQTKISAIASARN